MPTNSAQHDRASQYLRFIGTDKHLRTSLLACSAALRLRDRVATEIIRAAVPEGVGVLDLLRRVKALGCVWHNWDGSWRILDDLRLSFAEMLVQELPEQQVFKIREYLAHDSEDRFLSLAPDGQITNYRIREACFETAFQKTLIPSHSKEGAQLFADIWRRAPAEARAATCAAADYVSQELKRHIGYLPPEMLFLKGMAARSRGDRSAARTYFSEVWEQGQKGDIFAIAAHLFGTLVRDSNLAERAFRDSLQWYEDSCHQGQVWHSLGNLLSRQSARWDEAEKAYRTSLQLLPYASDQGQVWHSLGNLLSRQSQRWEEAEKAYRESLELRHDPTHQGQVWHSLGNLLSRQSNRWNEAEKAYYKSLELDPGSAGQVQVWHSLGNLLSRQSNRWNEAEKAYYKSLELDPGSVGQVQVWHSLGNLLSRQSQRWEEAEKAYRKSLELRHDPTHQGQVWHSLGNLLSRQSNRWNEAEKAYHKSLELRDDPTHQKQVYSSWAKAIIDSGLRSQYSRAEQYARRALSVAPDDPKNRVIVNRILCNLYDSEERYIEAISAVTAEIEAERILKDRRRLQKSEKRLKLLQEKLKARESSG